jgi:opacity protein-like surface antigen
MKMHMKNSRLAVLGGCALLAAGATTMQADVSSGFYTSSDAGLNLMTGIRSGSGEIRLDPGMRWGLEAGYGFKLADQLTLAVEAESGIIWNGFSSVKVNFGGEDGGLETEVGGNFWQVPVLGNVVLNYHTGKWTAYAGFGGGVDYVSANIWSEANTSIIGAGSDWGPAVQAEAGVRYQLTEKAELGLGYKYLTAFSEKLTEDTRLSEVNNHTISLSFTYHF